MSNITHCILCLALTPTNLTTQVSTLSQLLVLTQEETDLKIKQEIETCTLCPVCDLNLQTISKLENPIRKREKIVAMRAKILKSKEQYQVTINGDKDEATEFAKVLQMRTQYFFPLITQENENQDCKLEVKEEPENENFDVNSGNLHGTNWHVIEGIAETGMINSESSEDEEKSAVCILPDPLPVQPAKRKRKSPLTINTRRLTYSTIQPTIESSSDDELYFETEAYTNNKVTLVRVELGQVAGTGQCTKCGKFMTGLARHYSRPHPYACAMCPYTFRKAGVRNTHQEQEHGTPTIVPQCNICRNKFGHIEVLERHMVMEHETDEKTFTCAKCMKGFSLEVNFQRHLVLHELDKEKPLMCDVCDSRFPNQDMLNRHLRTHKTTTRATYQCEFCDAGFTRIPALERHVRLHTGEKPFKCDHCDDSFIDMRAKVRHTARLHSSTRHKCDICEKDFLSRICLSVHVENVHKGIRRLQCPSCPERFQDVRCLKSHKIRQHGEDPFICEECGTKYSTASGLRLHQLKHCGVKNVP
ncbi:zinc finger and SCAN domain-containing protein 12 isoform X2 [Folsomia candida]|uniref:zinc finger and SCAN domain-containing protein 12 isoform X2 n=1 Tax=Folsomia candida TaxID=158441 RepID=UPI001604FB4F|nr:zinc finger and SCAN domain-containing protein 12 isoform X2 [Folsomia candida]